MVVAFEDDALVKLFETPLADLKGKQKYPLAVIKQFKKKIELLIAIKALEDLKPFKGLNFEYLKGNRLGQSSIRLNDQYRLVFVPSFEGAIQILLIIEISKHYE